MDTPILKLENITIKKGPEIILENINLAFKPGDYACIYGRSGSGKTSLLRVMALLEKPYEGKLEINGETINWNNQEQLIRHRRYTIGYIPQHNNLIPQLTVEENILLPIIINRTLTQQIINIFKTIVKKLEIENLLDRYPRQLSGGQQRRAIIARALIKKPEIILADEPLAGLDEDLAKKIIQLFKQYINDESIVVHATPDTSIKAPCTHTYIIK
ncbi:MAG: ATP-binding cassette domain-containing protein [Desulfurococcales archaeon]|nr:ATP-binding cassette domain-containing protein [Desulfurococcales archaeon]